MLKNKDMIGIFNMLEFWEDYIPTPPEDEENESWWEENKGAIYAYSLGSIAIVFGLIPWLIGLVMSVKWIFF